jgi:peptidyl-prolyl cis-trans isomerase A (cyclophilin A)
MDPEVVAQSDEIAIVSCGTTKGPITIEFYKGWSPLGYDRVVHLFEIGFYDKTHFFRMVPKFLVQFGITYNDTVRPDGHPTIPDDPQLTPPIPFKSGMLSYAGT